MTETPVVVTDPHDRDTSPAVLELRVHSVTYQAQGVHTWELRDREGGVLPAFSAGAHIDLSLANGLVRSYSLCNSQNDERRYVVGVQLAPSSRGGSRFIHDSVRVGSTVRVTPPRNNFELVIGDASYVLIAGGIGITPLLSMIRQLTDMDLPWQLHYAVRERDQLAFLDELAGLERRSTHGEVLIHVDDEAGALLDIPAVVASAASDAQLYCCGPTPMLDAFSNATAHLPESQRHMEYFSNAESPSTGGGFVVELASSKMSIDVPPGQTILGAVEAAGVKVAYSCMDGVCGTCETKVLAGTPDHRDQVLTDREKKSNEVMMICCSGSNSPRLVLDL